MKKGFSKGLNLERKEVKEMRNGKWFIVLTMVFAFCLVTASAYALPTLLINEPSKMKYTNFERFFDNNNNSIIDTGDRFEGIFTVPTISNVAETVATWQPTAGVDELTGIFKISVVGGSIPIGGGGHIDFGLGTGDLFEMYYDVTPNWAPFLTLAEYSNPQASTAWGTASDGALYMQILQGTFYEGINDTVANVASVNRNWGDLTFNGTGYPIVAQQWPELLGGPPFAHTYLEVLHPARHVSDIFWESHLQAYGTVGWDFKSEDPLYVFATPEPSTFLLFGAGLIGIGIAVRRRLKK